MADGYRKIVTDGLWHNNQALVALLGLCPLLAVSNTLINGLGLGLATTLVLTLSNVSVSLIRNWVRPEIRLPVFVLIIASFVTTVELVMNAYFHGLYNVLGIFIPLIVTNCAILGRAESFASRNRVLPSVFDGLMMGLGFTLALVLLGAVRELLGSGTLFANADLLVNCVRLVKSDAEIALMREAGQIANRVMTTAIDRLEPGVRECDAVAAVYQAQMSGTAEFGGDYPAIVPMMPTGEKTSAPHLTWTDAPYENEQMVNLELAACRHRYHCPIARTAYLGKNPPAKLVELAERTVEGLNLTLEAIRPDMRAEEVELVWRKHIARFGLEKESRIGYAMGLNYPPDWGEHTVSLRPGDKTILEPGMTLHFMPGIWLDTYGFECSEPVLITENGCEKFIEFPQKLFVKH